MHEKIFTQTETITPSRADELLGQYRYDYQRPLREERVAFLKEQMEQGRFKLNTIVLAQLGGQRFLANGQHTLWAISYSGQTLDLPVVYYTVADERELADLYSTYDVGLHRKPSDSFAPYHLVEETRLTQHQLNSLYAAVRIINARFMLDNLSGGLWQNVSDIRAWAPVARTFFELVEGSPEASRFRSRHLLTVGLLTVSDCDAPDPRLRGTAEEGARLAHTFWSQVAWNNGLTLGDPRRTLNQFIVSVRMSGRQRTSGMEVGRAIRSVAACWNAFYEGRNLQVINVRHRSGPVVVLGTRYE